MLGFSPYGPLSGVAMSFLVARSLCSHPEVCRVTENKGWKGRPALSFEHLVAGVSRAP